MKNCGQEGFSVMEMVVVFLIIGILTIIVMPNLSKFRIKGIQSHAKNELSSLYSSEKIFFAAYGSYHSSLPYIGYIPSGIPLDNNNCPTYEEKNTWSNRHYGVGFASSAHIPTFEGQSLKCGTSNSGETADYMSYPRTGANLLDDLRSLNQEGITYVNQTGFKATAVGNFSKENFVGSRQIMDE